MNSEKEIFEGVEKITVLVIGDVMIDRYINGKIDRISPEAPVPIIESQKEEERLGGAANVALNIKALGARPILCSVIGKDKEGKRFLKLLKRFDLSNEGIISSKKRMTTTKTRVIASGQHLLRVDKELKVDLRKKEESLVIELIDQIFQSGNVDVVLFQDYNKGVLTKNVIQKVISKANSFKIPTVVDPKFKNFWNYKNVTLFKPNLKEIKDALKQEIKISQKSLGKACKILKEKLNNKQSMITLSEHGIFIQEDELGKILTTKPRNIADVSGAGDTVISVAAVGLALGLSLEKIAHLANLAGGQVCEKVGVVQVDKRQLIEEYSMSKARP